MFYNCFWSHVACDKSGKNVIFRQKREFNYGGKMETLTVQPNALLREAAKKFLRPLREGGG